VRNPDVWENHPVDFTRRLRAEGLPVNPRPIANLEVVEFAVVRRPPKGVELDEMEENQVEIVESQLPLALDPYH